MYALFEPSLVCAMPTGWMASGRMPSTSKLDLLLDLLGLGVDHRDGSADLGADPDLGVVGGELRDARARVDEHVGDDLERLGVDEVRHVGRLGGVDEQRAVVAHPDPLRFDADGNLDDLPAAPRRRRR